MTKPGIYLLRFGEMALKGRNRKCFEDNLIRIIKSRVTPLEGRIEKKHKKLLLHCDANPEAVRGALSTVFGLVSISPIQRTHLTMEDIISLGWSLMEPHAGSGKTFAVRARRTNKRFPMTSPELQGEVAAELLGRGLNLAVDLSNPDLTLGISIDFDQAYVYLESWPGLGGLPIDPQTKHGLLISGGIDSPVAGHLIQKRGGFLEAVYFHTPPFTVEAVKEKVIDLCSVLADYQIRLNLHVVNFTEAMKSLRAECEPAYIVVLQRRLMMRVATRIMERIGVKSLITGECLGQVASQTIENIAAINDGVTLPILRPLIGLDKLEIIAISKKIGTFDISIRPFQDCCSLFSPKNPVTKAKPKRIAREEARLDIQGLTGMAVEQTEIIRLGVDS